MLAFVIAWLVYYVLRLVALALSQAFVVNFFYAIGGGQRASPEESLAVFLHGLALYAPGAAILTTVITLVSLPLARFLASKFPRNHFSAQALTGASTSLAVGLITVSFNWIGAMIGVLALWPAAHLLRPQSSQT